MRAAMGIRHAAVALAAIGASGSASAADLVLPIRFDEFSTPLVELELDGIASTLMLDTGSAEGLHLARPILERIAGARFTGEMQKSSDMAGNVQENARFVISELSINGRPFRDVSGVEFTPWGVTVMGDADLPEWPVVGLGLFEDRRIRLDYQAQTLTIFDETAEAIPDSQEGWFEVPFRRTNEGLLLDASVAGKNRPMSLDSGASMSMVIADRIEDASLAVPCETVYPGLQEEDCRLIPVETTFGGVRRLVHAYLMQDDPGRFENAGLLGGDFLQRHAVFIDMQADRMFVRPITP